MSEKPPFKFEDKIDELDDLLRKNRGKWQLNALAWLDYDDICQIIRHHVYNKWHLWDQSRPFKPWVNTLIANQIKNQVRNHFTNFAKPCLKCPHNMGDVGEHCYITKSGLQCSECPLYAKWEKKKKKAYDVKLPVSLTGMDISSNKKVHLTDSFCYESASNKLHSLVLEKLTTDRQKTIYRMLYIENRPEEEVAKKMGFKADTSKRKKVRYKQIKNLQKKFREIAKKITKSEDLFY